MSHSNILIPTRSSSKEQSICTEFLSSKKGSEIPPSPVSQTQFTQDRVSSESSEYNDRKNMPYFNVELGYLPFVNSDNTPNTPSHTPVLVQNTNDANNLRPFPEWGVGFLSFLKYVPLMLELLGSDEFSAEASAAGGAYSSSNPVLQTFYSSENVSKEEISSTDYFQISLLIHYSLPYLWSSTRYPISCAVLDSRGESLGASSNAKDGAENAPFQQRELSASPRVLLHMSPVEQVAQFLNRVFSMTSLQMPTVVLALVYIRKLFCAISEEQDCSETFAERLAPVILDSQPPFYISGGRSAQPDSSCSQRVAKGYITEENLLVTAFILANKFIDDARFTNASWHHVSKIPLHVLNSMELEFLQRIGHRVRISDISYVAMLKHLSNVAAALDSTFYGKPLCNDRLPFVDIPAAQDTAASKSAKRHSRFRKMSSSSRIDGIYLRKTLPSKQLGSKYGTGSRVLGVPSS